MDAHYGKTLSAHKSLAERTDTTKARFLNPNSKICMPLEQVQKSITAMNAEEETVEEKDKRVHLGGSAVAKEIYPLDQRNIIATVRYLKIVP